MTESSRTHRLRIRRGRSAWRLAAAFGVLAAAALALSACSGGSQSASQTTQPAQSSATTSESATASSTATTATASTGTSESAPLGSATTKQTAPAAPSAGLQIKDIKVGTGATAKSGDSVTVDYTGWLTDGSKFDSSLDSHKPYQFRLGGGEVIQGWDQGVVGMKVGGTRQLIIAPSLGYGSQGVSGVVPADATLKFEVKLLAIQPGS